MEREKERERERERETEREKEREHARAYTRESPRESALAPPFICFSSTWACPKGNHFLWKNGVLEIPAPSFCFLPTTSFSEFPLY